MRALVYEGPRQMNIREVELPVPGEDEILIKVAYSGICGSELSGFLGHNSLRQPGIIFGHEFSGTIVGTGKSSAGLSVGQRVTANPLITCGHCRQCKRGQQQLCLNRKLLSASLPGSNADYVKVPASFVYPLPDRVSLEQGAMVEPIACAVRAVELASLSPSDSVLIMGMGPIGQLIMQVVKLHGVQNIIAVDMNNDRLKMVEQLGAKTINPQEADTIVKVREFTEGYGVDVAIDAVGAGITRNTCIQCASVGGTVIFTGLHEANSTLPINDMIRTETRTIGAFAYSTTNFETALRWIVEERIGLKEGIVMAPLEEGAHWFEQLLGSPGNVSKVLLFPPCRQDN